mmetsp:Transcript_18928/g.34186  ORF Transcript_18928/g.34186 Transcript_18928/m.34186 type:complete len:223 (+) Transcript_18928:38-706(+)
MAEVVTEQLSLFEQFYGRPGTIKAKVPEPDEQTVAREELVSGNLFGLPSQKPSGKVLWEPPRPQAASDSAGASSSTAPAGQAATASSASGDMTAEAKKELEQKLLSALFEQSTDAGPGAKAPTEQPPAAASSTAASDNLSSLSIKELKQRLQSAGASLPPGAYEKSDLVEALRNALASEPKAAEPEPAVSSSQAATASKATTRPAEAAPPSAPPGKRGRILV